MVMDESYLQYLNSTTYDLENVSVLVFHAWTADWARLASVEDSNLTVRFRDEMLTNVGDFAEQGGYRFLIDNVREGLDEPGEWYWDAAGATQAGSKLYFLPPGPLFNPETSSVIVPQLDTVVRVASGATNITFDGLGIEHATDGGMAARARTYISSGSAMDVG